PGAKRRDVLCRPPLPFALRRGGEAVAVGLDQAFELAGELLEGVRLQLPDALARQAELPADRLQRALLLAVETEPELDHATLALGEDLERLADAVVAQIRVGLRHRIDALEVGEQIGQLAVAV